jgi:thiamine-monophosphate kinase
MGAGPQPGDLIIESMNVSEIGEFGLIRLLAAEFGLEYPPAKRERRRPGLRVDLGDDAVVTERHDAATIWTTDTLVAGVHFLPDRTSWESLGWKALAVNLSDIAAMGGSPHLMLVTLALPEDFCVEDAQALYRGLHQAADEYGVMLGGGDIVRSPVFSITVALSGWATVSSLHEPILMTRDAARIGDVVAVTGCLGDSAAGLRLLRAQASFDSPATLQLREAHERPKPQIAAGKAAVRAGVRCAIDVSDGLVQDLGHIAQASGAGIRVDSVRVPISGALGETFPGEALGLALTGGEDYELVLIGRRPCIDALLASCPASLTEIGEVVNYDEPRVAVVDETGREVSLGPAGWDHFAGR